MLRIVLTVLFLLVLMAYGAGFILWNMTPIEVVGFQWAETAYGTSMPLAFLGLAGVVIGVLLMAIAASSAWAGQRASAAEARARFELAKKKLNERTEMVRVLRDDVASLRAALNAATGPDRPDASRVERDGSQVSAGVADDGSADDGVDDDVIV